MTPFSSEAVAAKFEAYPPKARAALLALRALVFETARATPGVDGIQETLKWGEPAYLTTNRAGTTVRMDYKPKHPDRCALYFHCQTNLVESFRAAFGDALTYEGNRAVVLRLDDPPPEGLLRECLRAALTYHLRK